jgi:hypothetical protein
MTGTAAVAAAASGATVNAKPRERSAGVDHSLPGQPTQTIGELSTRVLLLDGADWLIATDPHNEGRQQKWYESPLPDSRPVKVPSVIQDSFPDYHGVAWYWCDFRVPVNPHPGGRYLMRFHLVDYLADVWVNGTRIGSHEGGQEPFVLDASAALRPHQQARLAVRVLSPTKEPIDGIALHKVAEGRRDYPEPRDNAYATGGIAGSVELLVAPAVRVEDIWAVPDWKTGDVRIRVSVRNPGAATITARLQITVAPSTTGEPAVTHVQEQSFAPGDRSVDAVLRVENRRLWELNDPYLYRATVRLQSARTNSVDERSTRFGFRDFRFENGYFRLNGRRIRLHGPLYTVLQYPIAQIIPHDEELLRADVLNTKAMGFNIVRITCGPALPRQLDVFDELGLLAFEEHYGARFVEESSAMEERWDHSLASVIRRDRNHPSVVMWGMLNEVKDGSLFRHAVNSLELVRGLDQDRVVMLNSGRFDRDFTIGSFSNPGSRRWEPGLRDVHAYPHFPHTAEIVSRVRSSRVGKLPGTQAGANETEPVFLTEYGVCSGQDYPRFLRNFERLGKDHAPDARLFREKLDRFLADWEKWRLEECWARPEDYFAESQGNQAKLALGDFNVWLSNPALIGDLTSTQITDAWFHGCGITNYFRELKPGMADAYNDMAARARWCLFVEPVNVYRGSKVRLEAVLANHDDALKPGKYPARLQVVAPNMKLLFDRTVNVEIADCTGRPEPPFVQPALTEEITLDGPTGRYRFLATFQRGIPAGGGQVEFYASDPAEMPAVAGEVLVWGEDRELLTWLSKQGIAARAFEASNQAGREVIVASGIPPGEDLPRAFAELARHVARGSTVIFLTYSTLVGGGTAEKITPGSGRMPPVALRWAPFPLAAKPSIGDVPTWYFRADYWAKPHAIFHGLPCGGILDYTFYREILNPMVFTGLQPPLDAVAGALDTSEGYHSDLQICVNALGEGRFILNTLEIRANLGLVPAAERLLRNMLNFAGRNRSRALAELPSDFDEQLRSMGYN